MFGSGEGTRTHTVHALNVPPPAKLGYTTTFEIGTGEGTRTPTARSLKPLPPAKLGYTGILKLVDLSGLEPPRYYDFPPAPQAGAYCQFRHRSIEIDEGFGTRTQSCVYLRWCFPHLYVRTTGIGCPDRVICPLSWRTKMLPYLLLAGSSAFVTAERTAIHHASPVPSLINGRR